MDEHRMPSDKDTIDKDTMTTMTTTTKIQTFLTDKLQAYVCESGLIQALVAEVAKEGRNVDQNDTPTTHHNHTAPHYPIGTLIHQKWDTGKDEWFLGMVLGVRKEKRKDKKTKYLYDLLWEDGDRQWMKLPESGDTKPIIIPHPTYEQQWAVLRHLAAATLLNCRVPQQPQPPANTSRAAMTNKSDDKSAKHNPARGTKRAALYPIFCRGGKKPKTQKSCKPAAQQVSSQPTKMQDAKLAARRTTTSRKRSSTIHVKNGKETVLKSSTAVTHGHGKNRHDNDDNKHNQQPKKKPNETIHRQCQSKSKTTAVAHDLEMNRDETKENCGRINNKKDQDDYYDDQEEDDIIMDDKLVTLLLEQRRTNKNRQRSKSLRGAFTRMVQQQQKRGVGVGSIVPLPQTK